MDRSLCGVAFSYRTIDFYKLVSINWLSIKINMEKIAGSLPLATSILMITIKHSHYNRIWSHIWKSPLENKRKLPVTSSWKLLFIVRQFNINSKLNPLEIISERFGKWPFNNNESKLKMSNHLLHSLSLSWYLLIN